VSTWRSVCVGVTAGALLVQPKAVPMRDITLSGIVDPERRSMAATVVAAIGTPIGKIPIRGNLQLRIDCAGAFAGTISYHPMVRLFARIKRVDLVTELDGAIVRDALADCTSLSSDTVRGTAVVEKTELRGGLRMAADSVHFIGPAWTVGDSSYHSVLRVTRSEHSLDLRVNLYERGGSRRGRRD